MILLYVKKRSEGVKQNSNVEFFVPSLFNRFCVNGENCSLKSKLVRAMFWLITFGKTRIYYIKSKDGRVIHTSAVVPKCLKFPFLKKQDFEIGPCFTHPDYRGQGLYPETLEYIVSTLAKEDTYFYMMVDEGNKASIRGIEKSGFEKCGHVYVTHILKRYCKQETKG